MEGSTGTCQYLTQPTTRVPINEFKFQRPLLNQARTAHVASSISGKTMNLIFHVTNDWFPFPAFPCIPRWLVPFPRIPMYDWFHFLNFPIWLTTSRWGGTSVQTITAEWRLHPDRQHPGDVVPPPWPSQLNGVSTQTGSTQVRWYLRPDDHRWMASPPRQAAPRGCGSSALTVTAEWRLHPDWQHPGDVVPPPRRSPLNGVSTQTGSTQVMWFLRFDRHSWMVSPPRLAAPRWCGSSARTITAEWHLHPDWQHPGDVVPPLWPSQLNGFSTQTGQCVRLSTAIPNTFTHPFIGAMLILVRHQQWKKIHATANSTVQHVALINVKWDFRQSWFIANHVKLPKYYFKISIKSAQSTEGSLIGRQKLWRAAGLGFRRLIHVTAHARSRSTTYSSLSSRQFHIWSTSVPRPGKPSGDPAAASLIIS